MIPSLSAQATVNVIPGSSSEATLPLTIQSWPAAHPRQPSPPTHLTPKPP
jgi:hypothetical protein